MNRPFFFLKTICSNCNYKWISKAKTILVTCPSCGLKTKKVKGGAK